ncbi:MULTISPECIES: response regulator transcription factor [unclassified Beijerinckia]|uniref:response regulator n=1 Tax=unclassified Beijerinckia TaxID=2638183 RepID=UPI0008955845|nr:MULTISPECIES: response regulator transcription factor [unclassified Beijerinckia]MDH7797541.1 two-component system KDP operon response regulator KdpE [Beijerinckia sp. GAS462]SEC89762.1 two-component system, OmpR family, KDP operon response regulator KdpE [Beijerinckia sp. 28-YEA-48]
MKFGLKALIVDDDLAIRRFLRSTLRSAGIEVLEAQRAAEVLRLLPSHRLDLVILDLGLPDRDGQTIIPIIRKVSDAVILILSARDSTVEKVAALDAGADDYVTKPFDSDEFLARMRAAVRNRAGRTTRLERLSLGDVELDFASHQVRRGDEPVHLTPKEFALLAEMARHPGRMLTHGHLLQAVWGPAHEQDAVYLRIAVRALRRKLEPDPSRPSLIVNEPGVGYRLIVNGSDSAR